MIAQKQKFVGLRIHLDGGCFDQCVFERCTLVYSGVLGVTMDSSDFIDCNWEMQGPARETLTFLAMLHRAGARELVEATVFNILGRKTVGPTLN
ncbi:MAG: hypothetical protein JNL61_00290 [Rhizobiaceae bacterium]|nr:hypothetical protein [Rhizobiaceae bacterium]